MILVPSRVFYFLMPVAGHANIVLVLLLGASIYRVMR